MFTHKVAVGPVTLLTFARRLFSASCLLQIHLLCYVISKINSKSKGPIYIMPKLERAYTRYTIHILYKLIVALPSVVILLFTVFLLDKPPPILSVLHMSNVLDQQWVWEKTGAQNVVHGNAKWQHPLLELP